MTLNLFGSPNSPERERERENMGSKVEVIKDESLNCRKINSPQNNEEEEDEDDDGPPPGFDSLPLNLSTDIKHIKNEKKEESFHQEQDDDDDDGPPPGFQSVSLKDTKKDVKNESFIENIDDIDGPPPGFHSILVVESEKGDGLNPNSQSDLKILGDGSKLGFESIHVRSSGNGLNPIYQSDFKKVDECELGLRSISVKEDGKSGNGLESGLGLFNLEKCELGLQSNSEKGEENIIDGSEEPELGLQSISEKGKENGEEKIGDGSELGFESVPNKEKVKEVDESEIGSQPLPMIEDEKENNVCRTGLQSISQKVGIEEKNDDNDDDEGPPPGWGSFPLPRPLIESPAPPHHPRSSVSPRPGSGSAHVRDEERVRDELEVGSQLDPMKEDGKEDDGSELESQSFPTEEKGSTSVKEEEDDNEGPPPGWFSCHPLKGPNKAPSSPKLPPLIPAQLDPMKEDEKERDGSELESLSFPVKTEEKRSTPVKEVEDDEGPPPGWYSCHPSKGPCKALSPLTPAPPNPLPSATSSDEKGSTPVNEKDDEAPPPGWYSCHPSKARSKAMSPPQLPPLTPAPPNPQPSATSSEEKGSTPVKEKDDEGPPPGWYSCHPSKARSKALSPPQLPPLSPAPPNRQPSATSGKAQMVCGSCRTLLSYSEGSRFVQCSCCQTVNLVLEEHQVGQVKCRGCTLLLMYPYGAPSVQCSSCLFVTKVGVQNQRPPLSMQQGRPQLLANPVT